MKVPFVTFKVTEYVFAVQLATNLWSLGVVTFVLDVALNGVATFPSSIFNHSIWNPEFNVGDDSYNNMKFSSLFVKENVACTIVNSLCDIFNFLVNELYTDN